MQSEEAEENEDYYNFRYEVIIPDTKDSTVEDRQAQRHRERKGLGRKPLCDFGQRI